MQTTKEKLCSLLALIAVVVGVSMLVADTLVPVSAEVQPTMMVIQVIDVNGVETARLTVPATSRVTTFIQGGSPTPAPFPQPTPVPGKRTITILEESGERDTGKYAPIIFSTKIREYLKSKGHGLLITDVTAQTENVPQNLPQLRIDDGDGNLIYQTALPATEDAVLETIKAHGG